MKNYKITYWIGNKKHEDIRSSMSKNSLLRNYASIHDTNMRNPEKSYELISIEKI